jgi:threonine/homoserine/homoserine lactone efflux protein
VLLASSSLFTALRLAGAVYLIVLGAGSLLAALRGRTLEGGGARRRHVYRQGVLSNLGNPKMVVFFTSLLPQFASSFGAMLSLGVVFATITLVWLSLYAVAVARGHAVLLRTRVRRVLDALTGLVLVSFGLRLAAER